MLDKFPNSCLENVVLIHNFLYICSILEVFQFGFKALNSTEFAFLKVFNSLLQATDSRYSAILMLLDLTVVQVLPVDTFSSVSPSDSVLFGAFSLWSSSGFYSWANPILPLYAPFRVHS